MTDFVNTVELLGDDVVTDRIIQRTITEFDDNVITFVRNPAFMSCKALVSVNLPNVTEIGASAFRNCTALEKVDTSALQTLKNETFGYCTALTALIIRNTSAMATITSMTFYNSAIANGTGYVYVPSALLSTYKANSVWKTYANQIRAIEDHPDICG